MPPKPKFTRDEIIDAAYRIVRKQGSTAMTAREVARELGASSSPIFTVFKDMDELRCAVTERAVELFRSYMAKAEDYIPAYKMRGMQWVRFASAEPKLFQLLFMQHTPDGSNLNEALRIIPFRKEDDIAIITRDYNASTETAEHLFRNMWVYTYGLCALCAAGVCSFTDDEIAEQLGEIFGGMIHILKTGGTIDTGIKPTLKSELSAVSDSQYPNLGSDAKA